MCHLLPRSMSIAFLSVLHRTVRMLELAGRWVLSLGFFYHHIITNLAIARAWGGICLCLEPLSVKPALYSFSLFKAKLQVSYFHLKLEIFICMLLASQPHDVSSFIVVRGG